MFAKLKPIFGVHQVVNTDEYGVIHGLYEIGHFNGDHLLWDRTPEDYERHLYPRIEHGGSTLYPYGVCDNPLQFYKKFYQHIVTDQRRLAVFFTHVLKEPQKAGCGGGWRWHKWGDYVGEGKPTTEYLDDEQGFDDGIYCYHMYEVEPRHIEGYGDPAPKLEFIP
jgi:hypothetical protein